jgi:hypothetical protein
MAVTRFALAALLSGLVAATLVATTEGRLQAQAGTVARTPDGKPNLNGIWQAFGASDWNIEPHSAVEGRPAGLGLVVGGEIPYQPWAREQQRKNYASRTTADPAARCFMPGVPRAFYLPFPFEITQTSTHVGMAFEFAHATRTIFLDGTPHLEDLDLWMGDSRGRWEGDTLVVSVVSFNGQSWLDHAGNFFSQAAKLTERFTPRGPNHLDYQVTIEDPKVFTRPWELRTVLYRRVEPQLELLDYECVEQVFEKLFEERRGRP